MAIGVTSLELPRRKRTGVASDGDPLSARAELAHAIVLRRGDWSVRIETTTLVTCDTEAFHLELGLDAWEGKAHAFSRAWRRSIPRDGV